ncbi:MAG: hypothetical protein ACI4UV_10045 [Victivallales bacterium]
MYFIRISPFWNNLPEKNIFSIQIQLFFPERGKHPVNLFLLYPAAPAVTLQEKSFPALQKKFSAVSYMHHEKTDTNTKYFILLRSSDDGACLGALHGGHDGGASAGLPACGTQIFPS